MYNGKPIMYESDPGKFGVSQGFDRYISNKTQVDMQLEGWDMFANRRIHEAAREEQEEVGRNALEEIQAKSLQQVFDEHKRAQEQNWRNHTSKPGKGPTQMAQGMGGGPVEFPWAGSNRVAIEKTDQETIQMTRLGAAAGETTNWANAMGVEESKLPGDYRLSPKKQRQLAELKQKAKEEAEALRPPKILDTAHAQFAQLESDSSKLHSSHRAGTFYGGTKNTMRLGKSDREASCVRDLQRAEKQMRRLQAKQLKVAREKARKEAEAEARRTARRWKHAERGHERGRLEAQQQVTFHPES